MMKMLDRYLIGHLLATFVAVIGVVMSLMLVEHLPRLLELVRFSGSKSYIIGQSMLSLIPEYLSIGLLFGLFLAISLTVRRLILRGELDAIEAMGVPPWRWMGFPVLVAIVTASLLLACQGWLLPAGEARLKDLGQRMASGEFGYTINCGEFIDLGRGRMLRFEKIDPLSDAVHEVFLRLPGRTLSAHDGWLSMGKDGALSITLENGTIIGERNNSVGQFRRFAISSDPADYIGVSDAKASVSNLHQLSLNELLIRSDHEARAETYSRMLWPLLALLVPIIAYVLGKPPRRSASGFGVFAGAVLILLIVRSADFVATGWGSMPEVRAIFTMSTWTAVAIALLHGEALLGAGFVDKLFQGFLNKLVWSSRRHPDALHRILP